MKEQNLKNHKKYVPGYHFIAFGILIILLFVTGYSLYEAFKEHFLVRIYGILFLMTIYLMIVYFFSRIFALKAQDRAIRAEESLRHFIMTGKPFDSRLGIKQIIALRFASDEEFIELSKKAAEGNLSPDEIKKEINKWREDNYRA
jgi:glucan phosphoethanolaminetransferase (alkaline phosphatase superfamily)